MDPPTVIVVGDVVRLRTQLNWFETRPLFGKRILVTRAQEQARELSALLAEQGAEPVECPTIRLVPPESWRELDEAIAELRRYHWVIFTSVNGVRPFMERLRQRGQDARALAGLRLCCIGPRWRRPPTSSRRSCCSSTARARPAPGPFTLLGRPGVAAVSAHENLPLAFSRQ